jgi:hypothetical protein
MVIVLFSPQESAKIADESMNFGTYQCMLKDKNICSKMALFIDSVKESKEQFSKFFN